MPPEISREMARVVVPDERHDFLDAQERALDEETGAAEAEPLQISARGGAGLGDEELAEP